MEAAIKTVVGVFLKSAKGKDNLGSKEFQSLVKSQLKNILTGTEDNDAVKDMRQQLDNNQDGKVSFQEYMSLIGYLAQAVSEQRCLEKESQAESSAQEMPAANAEPQQAEPKLEPKAEAQVKPQAEPQVEPEVAKVEPEAKEAAAEVKKEEEQEEEKEEVKAEEKEAEEQNKTEEAS